MWCFQTLKEYLYWKCMSSKQQRESLPLAERGPGPDARGPSGLLGGQAVCAPQEGWRWVETTPILCQAGEGGSCKEGRWQTRGPRSKRVLGPVGWGNENTGKLWAAPALTPPGRPGGHQVHLPLSAWMWSLGLLSCCSHSKSQNYVSCISPFRKHCLTCVPVAVGWGAGTGMAFHLSPAACATDVVDMPLTLCLFLLSCLPSLCDPTSLSLPSSSPTALFIATLDLSPLVSSFSLNISKEFSLESYLHKTITKGARMTFLYGPGSIALTSETDLGENKLLVLYWNFAVGIKYLHEVTQHSGFRQMNSIPKPLKWKANCKLGLKWTWPVLRDFAVTNGLVPK